MPDSPSYLATSSSDGAVAGIPVTANSSPAALTDAATAPPSGGRTRPSMSAVIEKIAPTRDERLFLVLSIFIGVLSGLLVVAFRIAIEWIKILTLGSAPHAGQYRLLFVPAVAGLVVSALVFPGGARQRRQSDESRAVCL